MLQHSHFTILMFMNWRSRNIKFTVMIAVTQTVQWGYLINIIVVIITQCVNNENNNLVM